MRKGDDRGSWESGDHGETGYVSVESVGGPSLHPIREGRGKSK